MVLANILQPLIDIFRPVLVFFHDEFSLGWGTSIVALTVVVRALLLPLAIKQIKSMQGMARLAPEIKALQQKYKDDKQRQQQELMKFYQENKVNPFASCLPLLAQLPIFIALFYMLQDDLREDICGQSARPCPDGGEAAFLFIPNLTDTATGGVLIALVVLYISSQLVASLVTMTATTDRTQRMIFLALPFVFVLFIINFPAGLIVYWITTNLWTAGQQVVVRRLVGPVRPPEPAGDGGKDGGSGGGLLGSLLGGGSARGGDGGASNGAAKKDAAKKDPAKKPAGVGASKGGAQRRSGPPPPSPRKKKKRSGRRR